jgi:hypothetical protein
MGKRNRVEVAIGASNPIEGSIHAVDLLSGKEPICKNTTDAEFREMFMKLRDQALAPNQGAASGTCVMDSRSSTARSEVVWALGRCDACHFDGRLTETF